MFERFLFVKSTLVLSCFLEVGTCHIVLLHVVASKICISWVQHKSNDAKLEVMCILLYNVNTFDELLTTKLLSIEAYKEIILWHVKQPHGNTSQKKSQKFRSSAWPLISCIIIILFCTENIRHPEICLFQKQGQNDPFAFHKWRKIIGYFAAAVWSF
jgi:hypothetical protein